MCLALTASEVAGVGGVCCLFLAETRSNVTSRFDVQEVKLPNSTLGPQLGSRFVLLQRYDVHDISFCVWDPFFISTPPADNQNVFLVSNWSNLVETFSLLFLQGQ